MTHVLDARERVEEDLTTVTLHPTKGFRRVCGRRVEAQASMNRWRALWGMWATRNLAAAA